MNKQKPKLPLRLLIYYSVTLMLSAYRDSAAAVGVLIAFGVLGEFFRGEIIGEYLIVFRKIVKQHYRCKILTGE